MQVSKAEVESFGRGKHSKGPAAAVFVGTRKAAEGVAGGSGARGPAVPVHAEVSDDSSDEEDDDEDDDPVVKVCNLHLQKWTLLTTLPQVMPVYFNSSPDFSLPASAHFNPTLDDSMQIDGEASGSASTSKKAAPSLGPLALLQYPHKPRNLSTSHPLVPPSLRPTTGGMAGGKILARYRPGVRHLALEIPLEVRAGTEEERFNDDRARHFARGLPSSQKGTNAKGKRPARYDDEDDDPDPLARITLASQSIPEQTHYVVGIRRDDEIHLVPLAQTMQLRPSLEYLDRLKEMTAQASRAARRRAGQEADSSDEEEGGGAGGEGEEGEDSPPKKAKKKEGPDTSRAVQVSLAASGVDRGNNRAGASLFAPLRAAEGESWVPLSHYHSEVRLLSTSLRLLG